MTQSVQDGKVVSIHYTLKLASGQVVDSSQGQTPLEYLHGASNIVPGLETQITGKTAGDKFTAVVQPEDAYGAHNPEAVQDLPRQQFPDDLPLQPGLQLAAQDQQGNQIPMKVVEVHDSHVKVDLNHPLAGEVLNFDIEVVSMRDATAEEKEHGHAHGPGGHAH